MSLVWMGIGNEDRVSVERVCVERVSVEKVGEGWMLLCLLSTWVRGFPAGGYRTKRS